MIEINLLPGDGKKKRRAKTTSSSKFEFNLKPPLWLTGLTEKITDKYMLGAVIGRFSFSVRSHASAAPAGTRVAAAASITSEPPRRNSSFKR